MVRDEEPESNGILNSIMLFPETPYEPACYCRAYFQEKGHACCIKDYITIRPLARNTVKKRLFQRRMCVCNSNDVHKKTIIGSPYNKPSHHKWTYEARCVSNGCIHQYLRDYDTAPPTTSACVCFVSL